MALDTRDKRDSAIHISLPWRMRFPAPDGTISQADRQHVALLYRGILAGAAVVDPATLYGWLEARCTGRLHALAKGHLKAVVTGRLHANADSEE